MTQRKLHIGGKLRAAGWEVLDVNAGPCVDHVGDAVDLSRFETGTFAAVYASHVLEHFDYKDTLAVALGEWHRVLAPDGILYVSVPDLEVLAGLFLLKDKLSLDQRFQIMRMIFGGHVHAHDYHLTGLDTDILVYFLQQAGFVNLRRMNSFGLFQDTSELTVGDVRISLNVAADKPR